MAENANTPPQDEISFISRFVVILTPLFTILVSGFTGWVAQIIPGLHFDQNQILAFMTAGAAAALSGCWKWLQGWQQHERLVAEGKSAPAALQRELRRERRQQRKKRSQPNQLASKSSEGDKVTTLRQREAHRPI